MLRHKRYFKEISEMLGRPLRKVEFPKFSRVIKLTSDENLDESLKECRTAKKITDLGKYFIYLCSTKNNKEEISSKLEELKGYFK